MEIEKAEDRDLLIRIKDKAIVTPKFKEVLQTICYNIGIRDALDLNDQDSIFNFIGRNYGLLSLNDLIEAFELFSADKLKFADPRFGHYGSFDLTFIGKVLKAYTVYKTEKEVKPKVFELTNPNPVGSEERERAFYWVKFNFLDDSVRNGSKGSFPEIIICSWKDAYLHMIEKGMLTSLTDIQLQSRLKEAERKAEIEASNPRKRLSNSIGSQSNGIDEKTMLFYKYEVCEWFYKNKNELFTNN